MFEVYSLCESKLASFNPLGLNIRNHSFCCCSFLRNCGEIVGKSFGKSLKLFVEFCRLFKLLILLFEKINFVVAFIGLIFSKLGWHINNLLIWIKRTTSFNLAKLFWAYNVFLWDNFMIFNNNAKRINLFIFAACIKAWLIGLFEYLNREDHVIAIIISQFLKSVFNKRLQLRRVKLIEVSRQHMISNWNRNLVFWHFNCLHSIKWRLVLEGHVNLLDFAARLLAILLF